MRLASAAAGMVAGLLFGSMGGAYTASVALGDVMVLRTSDNSTCEAFDQHAGKVIGVWHPRGGVCHLADFRLWHPLDIALIWIGGIGRS